MPFVPGRFTPERPVEVRPVTPEDFEVCADYDGAIELHCENCGRWHNMVYGAMAPIIAQMAAHRCAKTWQSAEYGAES